MENSLDFLFSKFGLCPDYRVVLVDGEWVDYYEPDHLTYKQLNPSYTYTDKELEAAMNGVLFPLRTKLHLDVHTVEYDNGLTLSAQFAVSHSVKMIFLRQTNVEIGKIFAYGENK